MNKNPPRLYFTLKMVGITHYISDSFYETICKLPVTEGDVINITAFFAIDDFVNDDSFCPMCYDYLALKNLADV